MSKERLAEIETELAEIEATTHGPKWATLSEAQQEELEARYEALNEERDELL